MNRKSEIVNQIWLPHLDSHQDRRGQNPVCCCYTTRQMNWWPARVTRPVLRIKSPLHHFNACRPEYGARGRPRTCTGDALDVVSLRLDYASNGIGSSSRCCLDRNLLPKHCEFDALNGTVRYREPQSLQKKSAGFCVEAW